MTWDKLMSETDKLRVWASDEDMGRSESIMTIGALGIIMSTWLETVQVIDMKGMVSNELETS